MDAHGERCHLGEVDHRHDPLVDKRVHPIEVALLKAAVGANRVEDVLGDHLDEVVGRGRSLLRTCKAWGQGQQGRKRQRAGRNPGTDEDEGHHGEAFEGAVSPLETCWARLAK